MRRIATELPVAAVAAAIMASVVFIAGTAVASYEEAVLQATAQPTLCTPSYCEPPALLAEPVAQASSTAAHGPDR